MRDRDFVFMNSLIFTVIQTKKGGHTDLHNIPCHMDLHEWRWLAITFFLTYLRGALYNRIAAVSFYQDQHIHC